MVFDLLIGHRHVFVLFRGELITLGELKICDTRAAFAKLYVVVLHCLLTLDWKLEIDRW